MNIKEFCRRNGIPENNEGQVYLFLSREKGVPVKKTITGNIVIDPSNEAEVLILWNQYHEERVRAAQLKAQKEKEERERAEEERRRAEEELREEEEFLRQEEERIAEVARTMPITSTNGFDGYRIVEYGGYVSGDEVVQLTEGFFGGRGDFDKDRVNNKIKEIRSVAIDELKVAAAEIGCNAVVGLDFDYVTVDRSVSGLGGNSVRITFIILTANGTAVTIEPIR